MAFALHKAARQPDRPDQPIRRYLELSKFLYILQYQKLPFVRLEKMPDRFEGAPSVASIEASFEYYQNTPLATSEDGLRRLAEDSYLANQYFTYASCWHQNGSESAAMWAQYSSDGVAISTTYRALQNAVIGEPRQIFIGTVEYVITRPLS